jgi:hypothetical protein
MSTLPSSAFTSSDCSSSHFSSVMFVTITFSKKKSLVIFFCSTSNSSRCRHLVAHHAHRNRSHFLPNRKQHLWYHWYLPHRFVFPVFRSNSLGSYLISTIMPLIKAREYVRLDAHSTTEDDSSSNFENSATISRTLSRSVSTERVDYKSLDRIMAEPKLLEIFSIFVGKHFKVEMIYFLLQVMICGNRG